MVSLTGTIFGSSVNHAIQVERESAYEITNAYLPATTAGIELLATWRQAPFALTGTYSFVRSREQDGDVRAEAPLTPRNSLGLVGMWEKECRPRRHRVLLHRHAAARSQSISIALESLFHSRDCSRSASSAATRCFSTPRISPACDRPSTIRWCFPSQAIDGRWTVDAWAPLDGRTFNAGVRATF